MPKRLGSILGAVALMAVAGGMLAQEIVVISGNTVVIRDTRGTRKYTVMEGSKLMVDGKEMTVRELKPGMHVSAELPGPGEMVVVTQVREAKVLEVSGTNLIVRDGQVVKRYIVDPDFKFMVDGKEAPVTSLQPGMVLTTMIVTKASPTVEIARAKAKAARSEADEASERANAADKKAAAAKRRASATSLPKTASPWPLIGLLGFTALAAGLSLRAARRSRTA